MVYLHEWLICIANLEHKHISPIDPMDTILIEDMLGVWGLKPYIPNSSKFQWAMKNTTGV